MLVRRLGLVSLVCLVLGLLVGVGQAQARTDERAASYSAPLRQAVADLTVRAEVRTGYEREKFVHWIDADGDGCDTRDEVLLTEADDRPTVGSGCSITGGRWRSYYDGVSVTASSGLDIDHMVPLAEAWDSGARSWSGATRQAFANDLGDARSLVAVTASTNRSKGDRDVAEWLPDRSRCRYLREWVAVKHRWRLSVDRSEKVAMKRLARSCGNARITVRRAR